MTVAEFSFINILKNYIFSWRSHSLFDSLPSLIIIMFQSKAVMLLMK